jgi:N-acetylgalactosamine kinase
MSGASVKGSKKASEWLKLLNQPTGGLRTELERAYGQDPEALADAAGACGRAVEVLAEAFGRDARAVIVRSTGRVNLLGTHIDHRGGFTNPIAVKELFLVAEPRSDDRVVLRNAEPDRYPDESFSISEELPRGKIGDWDSWTHECTEERKRSGRAGNWSDYVRAAVLYLQHLHTDAGGRFDPPLRGMNAAVCGRVPPAAGLSSSSSLVVAAAEACIRINALALSDMDLVEACAAAEWYVGTRGGGADHAAIKFGRLDHIMHVGSFPFSVDWLPFPARYRAVLANSLKKAEKSAGARDAFNQRIACYVFGLALIRKEFPELAPRLEHLRDVNPRNLAADEGEVYRIIRSLPETATREEVRKSLGDQEELVERTFRTHAEPADGYKIRQVCLYGVCECIRSSMAAEMLKRGDVPGFGELVTYSHDGDRVSQLVEGRRVPCETGMTDPEMDRLMADARSADADRRERARLWRQPGGYDASTEELDTLVDAALAADGVVGAGLVGAGLGGSIVAVVEEAGLAELMRSLERHYYGPRGLPVAVEVVRPVGGAGILEVH